MSELNGQSSTSPPRSTAGSPPRDSRNDAGDNKSCGEDIDGKTGKGSAEGAGVRTCTLFRSLPYSWLIYDWANTAFSTIIITFVFSAYITRDVFGDPATGSAAWGYVMAISGVIIALSAPVCGAFADSAGSQTAWLRLTTFICVVFTALLSFLSPDAPYSVVFAFLAVIIIAQWAAEIAFVFYNALLPSVSTPETLGRISGIGWGLGYLGGLAALVCVLFLFIGVGELSPLLALPAGNGWPVRAACLFTAIWYFLFSLPILIRPVRQNEGKNPAVKSTGIDTRDSRLGKMWTGLKGTAVYIWGRPRLFRFFVASMIYRDGLATLFAVGGTFAAAAYGLDYSGLLIFAIGLNVAAAIGAMVFARLDDHLGPLPVIYISLAGLILSGIFILIAQSKVIFIILSFILGLFIGPVQASSRSYIARLAPQEKTSEIFGFYALSGKAVAFLGPLLYASLTHVSGNARIGLLSVLVMWSVGLLILFTLRSHKV